MARRPAGIDPTAPGAAGLLGTRAANDEFFAWLWDEDGQFYINEVTGQIITDRGLLQKRDELIVWEGELSEELFDNLFAGTTQIGGWAEEFSLRQQDLWVAQYLLARGGRYTLDDADRDLLRRGINHQREFMRSFIADITGGTLTEARIVSRGLMYYEGTRQAFHQAQGRAAMPEWVNLRDPATLRELLRDLGLSEEEIAAALGSPARLNDLLLANGVSEEIAQTVVASAFGDPEEGPWNLPAHPGDGGTPCLSRCRCYWDIERRPDAFHCRWIAMGDDAVCEGCLDREREYSPWVVPRLAATGAAD